MTGVQVLVEWLVTFIEVVFYFSIIHVLSPEQFKRKKRIMMFLVITSIITTGVILLNFIDLSFSLTTIVYSAFAFSFGACILFQVNFISFLFVAVVFITGLSLVEGTILHLLDSVFGQGVSEQFQSGFSTMRIYVLILFKIVDSVVMMFVHFILKRAALRLGKVRIALAGAILGFVSATYWLSTIVETDLK